MLWTLLLFVSLAVSQTPWTVSDTTHEAVLQGSFRGNLVGPYPANWTITFVNVDNPRWCIRSNVEVWEDWTPLGCDVDGEGDATFSNWFTDVDYYYTLIGTPKGDNEPTLTIHGEGMACPSGEVFNGTHCSDLIFPLRSNEIWFINLIEKVPRYIAFNVSKPSQKIVRMTNLSVGIRDSPPPPVSFCTVLDRTPDPMVGHCLYTNNFSINFPNYGIWYTRLYSDVNVTITWTYDAVFCPLANRGGDDCQQAITELNDISSPGWNLVITANIPQYFHYSSFNLLPLYLAVDGEVEVLLLNNQLPTRSNYAIANCTLGPEECSAHAVIRLPQQSVDDWYISIRSNKDTTYSIWYQTACPRNCNGQTCNNITGVCSCDIFNGGLYCQFDYNIWAWIGIGVGAFLILAILVGTLLYLRKKRAEYDAIE